eukprot:1981123-Amphidinium_carterae.2
MKGETCSAVEEQVVAHGGTFAILCPHLDLPQQLQVDSSLGKRLRTFEKGLQGGPDNICGCSGSSCVVRSLHDVARLWHVEGWQGIAQVVPWEWNESYRPTVGCIQCNTSWAKSIEGLLAESVCLHSVVQQSSRDACVQAGWESYPA